MTDRSTFRVPRSAWLLLLGAAACGSEAPAPPKARSPAIPVRLAPVIDTLIVQPVTATGVLGAKEEVPLGFKIGGVVGRILVEEGDAVAPGQLLATLELPEIAGEVAKAEAGLTQADRDLTRAEALYVDSVIPRSSYEGAGTAVDVARANLEIARFNQRYAAIRAPSAGTILRRSAEAGQQIAGGVPVLILASAGRGQVVRLGLADRDVARVSTGDPAVVRFDQHPETAVTGRVSQIAAQATPGTGTWTVEVRLDHPVLAANGGVRSGLIGAAEITPRRAERVRLIPVSALLEGDADSAVVYTVATRDADTVAERHRVRVAFITGEQAAVRAGLDGIREVVTEGAGYAQGGGRVRPVKTEPLSDGGAP
jgi:multidrug efflux system membrane fusion protein